MTRHRSCAIWRVRCPLCPVAWDRYPFGGRDGHSPESVCRCRSVCL